MSNKVVVQSGGDDVAAIVVDPGYDSIRIGNCQEDYPREYLHSTITRSLWQNEYLPWEPLTRVKNPTFVEARPAMQFNTDDSVEVEPFVLEQLIRMGVEGVKRDPNAASNEAFLKALEHDDFMAARVGGLGLDITQHPMLITEPTSESKQFRDIALEVLFESIHVPCAYLAKRASLSAFSVGRQSAMVLDLGAGGSVASPVHEGISLQSTIQYSLVGGHALDTQMAKNLYERGHEFFRTGGSVSHEYHRLWIAREIRENLCSVSPSEGPQSYRLPDGDTVQVDSTVQEIPRYLFSSENATISEFNNHKGLSHMVSTAIFETDVDARRELLSSIVIVGGLSLTKGLVEALTKQFTEGDIGKGNKFKVVHPSSYTEARYSTWLGGSILASLGRFQQLWISAAEYKENGNTIAYRRCH